MLVVFDPSNNLHHCTFNKSSVMLASSQRILNCSSYESTVSSSGRNFPIKFSIFPKGSNTVAAPSLVLDPVTATNIREAQPKLK